MDPYEFHSRCGWGYDHRSFIYSENGKVLKIFGPDDNDALSLLSKYIDVTFVTGDKKGFPISRKRIEEDMNYKLHLVSTIRRIDWIPKNFIPEKVVYMGDGIFDHYVMRQVGYSIAPANADQLAKLNASFVTDRNGGDRAVAEACLHLLEKFFVKYDPNKLPTIEGKDFGEWSI